MTKSEYEKSFTTLKTNNGGSGKFINITLNEKCHNNNGTSRTKINLSGSRASRIDLFAKKKPA